MRDSHVTELIDGFLLGALEPAEEERVHAHVLECPACAQLLAEARIALDALADSLPASPLPAPDRAAGRARLLAAAAGRPAPPDRRGVRVPAWTLGAAASVAVVLVTGLSAWVMILSGRIDDREAELLDARRAAASFAATQQTLHMESDYGGNAIDAAIAVPAEGQQITIVVRGLPPPADGHGYRLWLLADGSEPLSLTLSPDADGNVVARAALDLGRFDEMELDAQPFDATAPGGELVIGGPLR